jgi:hypothetical protein
MPFQSFEIDFAGMKSIESGTTSPMISIEPQFLETGQDRSLFRLLLNIETRLRKEMRNESRIAVAKKWIFGSQNDLVMNGSLESPVNQRTQRKTSTVGRPCELLL